MKEKIVQKTFKCPKELDLQIKKIAKTRGLSENKVIEIASYFLVNAKNQGEIIARFFDPDWPHSAGK